MYRSVLRQCFPLWMKPACGRCPPVAGERQIPRGPSSRRPSVRAGLSTDSPIHLLSSDTFINMITRVWNWFGLDTYAEKRKWKHCQISTAVDIWLTKTKTETKGYMVRDPEKRMEATGFKYSWKKMETAAQDRARSGRAVSGLCSTGSFNEWVGLNMVSWWCSGYIIGLATRSLSCNNHGRLVHIA